MSRHKTIHNWICTDIPGHYMCRCGATGYWNSEFEKVEVLEPVPYEKYLEFHSHPKVG